MKLMVTGASGMTGSEIVKQARLQGHACAFYSHLELDITDASAVRAAVSREKPHVVLNAAAYTAVDAAENEPETAQKVNADGAENLAAAARDNDAAIIHISTDYVFDGTARKPYAPDDPTCPINVYGHSKLDGETAVRQSCDRHVIVRTSWVYSDTGRNFVRTMLRLATERDELKVVNDQHGSPTSAPDLAGALLVAAKRVAADDAVRGTYHFCNAGITTWHDFAMAIFELRGGARPHITAIPAADFPTPAKRPAYSALDTTTFTARFGMTPRPWRIALADILGRIT
jgi:dTDP-4-dehydrorhamnose reductase